MLSDFAQRFHQIKTPRKLLWKKNLGTVKVDFQLEVNGYTWITMLTGEISLMSSLFGLQLELQFEDRSMQFTVVPVHAAIIMRFQENPR
jgi:anaphase-promoting complex subunit 2